MKNFEALSQIKAELKKLDLLPKEIELSRFSNFYFSNIKYREYQGVISESVVCGFDSNPEVALLKSLSEYVESLSFQTGANAGLASCATERSDGFAAFPRIDSNFKAIARQNAFAEAAERYAWASWWDNTSVDFEVESIPLDQGLSIEGKLLNELSGFISISSVMLIRPKLVSAEDLELCIFIAFIKTGGVISGGACGKRGQNSIRAISELIRHGLAAQRYRTQNITPESFYEKRLCFFISPMGEELVRRRIGIRGHEPVILPSLVVDEEVPSVAPEAVYVHRCLFENQPLFIGGNLERFCI